MYIKKYIGYLFMLAALEISIAIFWQNMGRRGGSNKDPVSIQAGETSFFPEISPSVTRDMEVIPENNYASISREEAVLKESGSVEDEYFSNTLFIGDNRMVSFSKFSQLSYGTYLTSSGLGVDNFWEKDVEIYGGETDKIEHIIQQEEYKQIYLSLGINNLSDIEMEDFLDEYARVIDEIRGYRPDADIVILSIVYVTSDKSESGKIYNNSNIDKYNEALIELAMKKGSYYLDLNETLKSKTQNALDNTFSSDGINLNQSACKKWLLYLRTHVKI